MPSRLHYDPEKKEWITAKEASVKSEASRKDAMEAEKALKQDTNEVNFLILQETIKQTDKLEQIKNGVNWLLGIVIVSIILGFIMSLF